MDKQVSREVSRSFRSKDKLFSGVGADALGVLATANSDLAVVLGQDGKIIDVSYRDRDLKAWDVDGWVGKRWQDTVTVESRGKIDELFDEAAKSSPTRSRQVNHPSKTERDLPVGYRLVSLSGWPHKVALGTDLRPMAEMQQRLIRSQIELAERLRAMTPPALNKVFFTNSGTEANEAAFLITTLNRGSNELVALRHSYHGRSFATINASGQQPWRSSTLSPLHVHYVGNPYCYRCPWEKTYPSCDLLCARDVGAVIETTTSGHPAAFVAEPIQGVGGFITPPPEYFQEVQAILRRHGVPFVADEVQTAWGRTGAAEFGFQAYGVEPDVVVFAKGLANGIPIGGVIATDELALAIRSLSLSTFGGNPIATTAALANLNYIATHNLRENARRVGAYLLTRLHDLAERHPAIGDVRGMGLMVAIELVHDRARKTPAPDLTLRVLDAAKARSLIVGKGGLFGNVIRLCPPLIVTEADVDAAIAILDEAFAAVSRERDQIEST